MYPAETFRFPKYAPSDYNDFALADLDGDGDLDLFGANAGANTVWFNLGGDQAGPAASFFDSGQRLGSSQSQGVALGDLDGDGDLDAFVANGGPNKVWLNGKTTRVQMSLVTARTPLADPQTGEVASLPANPPWIDEWQPFIVEIWVDAVSVNTVGVASARVDLAYPTEYFTVADVSWGPAFTQNRSGNIRRDLGLVENLGAATARTDVGDGAPALLARVHFAPASADTGLPPGRANQPPWSQVDVGVEITAAQVTLTDSVAEDAELGRRPDIGYLPVIYDLNKDRKIGFDDFSYFAAAFLQRVADSNESYVRACDFDGSGVVDFGDFAFFAANFLSEAGDSVVRQYPPGILGNYGPQLRIDAGESRVGVPARLSEDQLAPVFGEAVARVEASADGDVSQPLSGLTWAIVDLPDGVLARTDASERVEIDVNAAGFGWYVDPTPRDDMEFAPRVGTAEFVAPPASPAYNRVDLLTAVMHELGHILGRGHDKTGLMQDTLSLATRRPWFEFGGALDAEMDPDFDEIRGGFSAEAVDAALGID